MYNNQANMNPVRGKIQDKKLSSKIQRSRLIVRNLSFKATEDDVRKVFSTYGKIVNLNIPKKDNGASRGFAFLSYDNVASSLKAIKFVNGQKILNRKVAVDSALAKNVYTQLTETNGAKKNEKEVESDEEDGKYDDDGDDEESENGQEEENEDEEDESDEEDEGDEEHEENDKDEEEDDKDEDEDDFNNEVGKKRKARKESDVKEGKTVFIRNLDLDTSEETLSALLSSFGSLEYCKLCIDEYTGRSRGTAFAKFKSKDDADKCVAQGKIAENPKLFLDGQQLSVTLALSRNQVVELHEAKQRKYKDKRNLYLAKEGLIYPNSPAAVGVSQNDLKKRLTLEERKRKLLQNNHNFISDTRLCVHNLPANIDDQALRNLFLKAVKEKNCKILWAKVMRNRSKVDNKFGKSKGFGFVEFSEPTHALKALRYLNNNPDVFTAERRPIVEFSVENKVALNKKKYRLLKEQKEQTDGPSIVKSDFEENRAEYSGVNAKPLSKGDKVIQPKFNRKLREVKHDLKKRSKELKKDKARQENLERRRVKITKKKNNPVKPLKHEEEDPFERHHRKRKHAFIIEDSKFNSSVIKPKKTKWFLKK